MHALLLIVLLVLLLLLLLASPAAVTVSSSSVESFDIVPEVQRMWVRPLSEPFVNAPTSAPTTSNSLPARLVVASEKWGEQPFRVSDQQASPITIRALPGSDSFLIQTVRWRDARPDAKSPHGQRAGAFDYTQTLVWEPSPSERAAAVAAAAPPSFGSKLPDTVQAKHGKPKVVVDAKNAKGVDANKNAKVVDANKNAKVVDANKNAKVVDANKNAKVVDAKNAKVVDAVVERPSGLVKADKEVLAKASAVAANDASSLPSRATSSSSSSDVDVGRLVWRWIKSSEPVPLDALFQSAPYRSDQVAAFDKDSQWNILFANKTPICHFHLESWNWKSA